MNPVLNYLLGVRVFRERYPYCRRPTKNSLGKLMNRFKDSVFYESKLRTKAVTIKRKRV